LKSSASGGREFGIASMLVYLFGPISMPMKHPYLLPLLEKFESNTVRTKELFSLLNIDQLNWKPSPKSWSIAQCLDHLIVSNTTYFPTFKALASQSYKPGIWARISPFSNYLGQYLLDYTTAEGLNKGKAPSAFKPSNSTLSSDILNRFAQHQKELRELVERLDMWSDHEVVIPSPAAGILTYKLNVCIQILAQHEARHIRQAERVLSHPDFPSLDV